MLRKSSMPRHHTLIFVLPVCLFFTVFRLQAQGEFLDRGQSGFGLDVLGLAGNGDAGLATGAGYSIGGMFDIGLSLDITWLNEEEWGPSAESRGWGPGIAIHALRQSDVIPVSVALFASYIKYKYNGANYVRPGWIIKSENTSLGLAVYHKLYAGPRLTVIPLAELAYSTVTQSVRLTMGGQVAEYDRYFIAAFCLPFSISITQRHRLVLGPVIKISDYKAYWGFSLGYVLGHPSRLSGRKR
jgi:hypothetical protein